MKKPRSNFHRSMGKFTRITVLVNVLLFIVFYFDLDGKLLYHVVEPTLCKHYDNMPRRDMLKTPYEMDKFKKYEY